MLGPSVDLGSTGASLYCVFFVRKADLHTRCLSLSSGGLRHWSRTPPLFSKILKIMALCQTSLAFWLDLYPCGPSAWHICLTVKR